VVAHAAKGGMRGKSELRRAERSLTATRGDAKESATERETTPSQGGERVKR